MSDYITLCQDVRRECGIPGTGPTALTGNSDELDRIVNWVADAWVELQNRHPNWRWLRSTATVSTSASDDDYASSEFTDSGTGSAISRFGHWHIEDPKDPPKIYLTSTGSGGERWLTYTPWEYFKSIYKIGTQNDGAPVHITMDPSDNIVLGPAPDADYTVTLDYYKSAQVFSATTDTPEMPSQFHKLLVYMAMEQYGFYESAQEMIARAQPALARLTRQLENNQLPQMRFAGPMA